MANDTKQASPETDASAEVDYAELGESEFAEQSKSDSDTASPAKEQAAKASPDDPDADASPDKDKQDADDKTDPDEAEEATPEDNPVESFLTEMAELKAKSEENGTDEYSQKLKQLEKDDPVKYRLWRSESRVDGLMKGYQSVRTEKRQYEKKVRELQEQQAKSKLDGFQELTPDELVELTEDERVEYRVQKAEIERQRAAQAESEPQTRQVEQWREYEDFLFNEFGLEIQYDENGKATNLEAVQDKVPIDLTKQMDADLERLFGKDTVYTADQIRVVYNHLNLDNIRQQERIKARADLKRGMENAEQGRQGLDRLPSNSGRKSQPKKLEDLDIEDLEAMGEKEFEAWEQAQN